MQRIYAAGVVVGPLAARQTLGLCCVWPAVPASQTRFLHASPSTVQVLDSRAQHTSSGQPACLSDIFFLDANWAIWAMLRLACRSCLPEPLSRRELGYLGHASPGLPRPPFSTRTAPSVGLARALTLWLPVSCALASLPPAPAAPVDAVRLQLRLARCEFGYLGHACLPEPLSRLALVHSPPMKPPSLQMWAGAVSS